MNQQQFFINKLNRKNAWYGLAIMAVVLVLLFILVKSIFKILYFLSPLLLILTLIFDYKVIVNFLKWVWGLAKSNILYAILVIVLSVIGFPILAGGLCANAFMNWRLRRAGKNPNSPFFKQKEEYSEFELLDEGIELKEKIKQKR